MKVTYRPLDAWPAQPRDDADRQSARFDAPWRNTDKLLRYEASRLDADEVVICLDVDERDIYVSGEGLKSGRKPRSPAAMVVLTFRDGTTQSHHCDLYRDRRNRDGWRDNVRAIAKTLEALRAIDRWGAADGRQYAGFRELGAGDGDGDGDDASRGFATVESAARFVAVESEVRGEAADLAEHVISDPDFRARLVRFASKRLHPDADTGGNPDQFRRLQEAKRMLDEHGASP